MSNDETFDQQHRTLVVTIDDSLTDQATHEAAEKAVATRDALVARRAVLYADMDAAEAAEDQAKLDQLHDELTALRSKLSDLDEREEDQ